VDAQSRPHYPIVRGNQHYYQPSRTLPTYGYGINNYGTVSHYHHHRQTSVPYMFGVYMVPPPQPVWYSYPVSVPTDVILPDFDSMKLPKPPSSAAARLKSLNYQARGDQRLREQKWSEAKQAYNNAVSAATDRAEPHFRLALCDVVVQRFDAAIREFKRAVALDPTIVNSSEKMPELFGPDSQIVRMSIVSKLGDWVREDIQNADRLFLFGAILKLNGDPQANDVLLAAMKKQPNENKHITLFLNAPNEFENNAKPAPAAAGLIPKLNARAPLPMIAQPVTDLRFPKNLAGGPSPMPEGNNQEVPAPVPMP